MNIITAFLQTVEKFNQYIKNPRIDFAVLGLIHTQRYNIHQAYIARYVSRLAGLVKNINILTGHTQVLFGLTVDHNRTNKLHFECE